MGPVGDQANEEGLVGDQTHQSRRPGKTQRFTIYAAPITGDPAGLHGPLIGCVGSGRIENRSGRMRRLAGNGSPQGFTYFVLEE